MGCLSLKATIGGGTAFTVVLVAAVCLSITLTVSLDAIRDMGKGNSAALVKSAYAGLQQHFSNPAKSALYIRERAIAEEWQLPTSGTNATVFQDRALQEVKDGAMIHRDSVDRMQLFWLDATRAGARIRRTAGVLELENATGHPTQLFLNFTRSFFRLNDSVPQPTYQDPGGPTVNTQLVGMNAALIAEFHGDNNTGVWVAPVLLSNPDGSLEVNYPALVPLRGGLANPDHLVGVLYFSIRSNTLAGFLDSVKATPNTQSMLYDRTKLVIATTIRHDGDNGTVYPTALGTSTLPAGCLVTGTNDAILCLPYIANLSVPAFDAVSNDDAFLFNEGSEVVRLVKADGKHSYVAQVDVAKPLSGLSLYVMLAVPEEDVIGDVVAGRNLAIGLSCAILVVAVALAVALIVVLLAPLSTVAERMAYAATLEDDQPFEERSAMAEIAELEAAYDEMNHELQRLKAFVPQSLLRQGMEDADLDLEASINELTTNDDTLSRSRRSSEARSVASNRSRHSRKSSMAPSHAARKSHSASDADTAAIAGGILKTDTSLKRQRVTVLCLNTLGFNKALADFGHTASVTAIAAMVDTVSTAVQDHRGVIDSFHGDHFTATFNAVHACPGHQRKAVHCGLRLARELATTGFKLTPTMGVASGDALVGNVGSATLKHFCVLGPALPQAAMLERLAKVYPDAAPHVLLSGRVTADVASNVIVRPVDIVLLPGRTRPSVVSVALGEVSEDSGTGGEWLYVLQQQGTGAAGALSAAFDQVAAAATRDAARAIVADLQQQTARAEASANGVTPAHEASIARLSSACLFQGTAEDPLQPVHNVYGALHTAMVAPGFVNAATATRGPAELHQRAAHAAVPA